LLAGFAEVVKGRNLASNGNLAVDLQEKPQQGKEEYQVLRDSTNTASQWNQCLHVSKKKVDDPFPPSEALWQPTQEARG